MNDDVKNDNWDNRVVTGGELAEELSLAFPNLPASQAKEAFRGILHAMQDTMVRGDRIEVRGFGSFTTRFRQGGIRRNPLTNEQIYATPRWVVMFRAGKELRELIDATLEKKPAA